MNLSVNQLAESVEGRFDFDLEIQHHFTKDAYAKRMKLPKGSVVYSHKHVYDHFGIAAKGSVLVRTDEGEQIYEAGSCINIKPVGS